jgi:WD40 repeat protein
MSPEDRELLLWRAEQLEDDEGWYRLDENSVPPVYLLQPRGGKTLDYGNVWKPLEAALHQALRSAADQAGLPAIERVKYFSSATEQEILQGAFLGVDARRHIFCFTREIQGDVAGKVAENFLDLTGGDPDRDSAACLADLKGRLRNVLGRNYHEYSSTWGDEGPSLEHIDLLCSDVYQELERVILDEVSHLEETGSLDQEISAHLEFGKERALYFTGREEILKKVDGYLHSQNDRALVIQGISGSGKSALMARIHALVQVGIPSAVTACRYIKATPGSSDGRFLLESIGGQISCAYGVDASKLPSLFYDELVVEFNKILKFATEERPLVLILDALDQLDLGDEARSLGWLPDELPPNVKLLVTTLPGECLDILESRLLPGNILPLEIMSMGEGATLLDRWLFDSGRTLQADQRKDILEKFQVCRLPLYLKLAFEEARRWRSYDRLPLGADQVPGRGKDIQSILRDLFWRLSLKANHGELLVGRSLAYLAAARNGLAEDELLEILSRDKEVYTWFLNVMKHTPTDLVEAVPHYLGPERCAELHIQTQADTEKYYETTIRNDKKEFDLFLEYVTSLPEGPRLPVVLWSRLFIDLEPYLAERRADQTSLITFYHDTQIRSAVNTLYLQGDEKTDRHRVLAGYFASKPDWIDDGSSEPDRRKTSELPYQLAQAGMVAAITDTLTRLSFLHAKLMAGDFLDLARDYEMGLVLRENEGLRLIAEALRISAHVVWSDTYQLSAQLLGRLLSYAHPEIQKLLAQAREWSGKPWLRPLTPCLTPAGGPERFTLSGHNAEVTSVMVTPDGALAVSGGGGNEDCIRVWDLNMGALIHYVFSFSYAVFIRGISSDGKRVIASESRKTVLYDIGEKKWLFSVPGHALAVSKDCRVVVTSKDRYPEKGYTYKCWDLENQLERFTFPDELASTREMQITPDGSLGVIDAGASQVLVWDLLEGTEKLRFSGHSDPVSAFKITPDGKRVISVTGDGDLRVWDLEDGRELNSLQVDEQQTRSLEISRDGKHVFTMGGSSIGVWEIEKRKKCFDLGGHLDSLAAFVVTPNGEMALSASEDGMIKVWDLGNGKEIASLPGHTAAVNEIAITPDGRFAVSASNDHTLKVWDLLSKRETPLPAGHASCITALAVSADGQRAITAAEEGEIKTWDLATGGEMNCALAHSQWIVGLKIIPDSRQVVSASYDKTLKVWDLESGRLRMTLSGHDAEVTDAILTPDGASVISASLDKTVKVWDLASGLERYSFQGHTAGINVLAITPDGRFVLSGGQDNILRVWDLETGQERAILTGHTSPIFVLAVTPDGRLAVSGSNNNNLIVWDLVRCCAKFRLIGRGCWGNVNCVVITPDQQKVISVPFDEENDYNISLVDYTMTVWDLATGRPRKALDDHKNSLIHAAISPDGGWLVSASQDQTLKLWDLEKGSCVLTYHSDAPFNSKPVILPGPFRVVAGDSLGRLHILSLEGLDSDEGKYIRIQPPLITAHGPGAGSHDPTFTCPFCMAKSQMDGKVLGAQAACQACGQNVRLNPFLVNREWLPVIPPQEPGSVPVITHTRESLEKEGNALLDKDPARALVCFEDALVLVPREEDLRFGRMKAFAKMGQHLKAVEAVEEILNDHTLRSDAKTANLHAWKGNHYYCLGDFKAATGAYRQALELDPGVAATWYMNGIALIKSLEYDRALASLKKAWELQRSEETLVYIGSCFLRLSQYTQAEQYFERLLSEGVTLGSLYYNLGVAKKALSKWEEARLHLNTFLDKGTPGLESLVPVARKILDEIAHKG